MKIKLVLLVVISTFTACIPFPNRRYSAPEVAGTLVRNGIPVANAEIFLTATFPDDAATTVRTDAAGRFKLGPLSKIHFIASLLGDPMYAYVLKIRPAGEDECAGLEATVLGYLPKKLQVTCDLDKPIGQGESLRYCAITKSDRACQGIIRKQETNKDRALFYMEIENSGK